MCLKNTDILLTVNFVLHFVRIYISARGITEDIRDGILNTRTNIHKHTQGHEYACTCMSEQTEKITIDFPLYFSCWDLQKKHKFQKK